MLGNKRTDDGKTQTCPSAVPRARAIYAVEAIKDVFLFFWSNAHPCIDDLYLSLSAVLAEFYLHLSTGAIVADGVFDQIVEHLAKAVRM